MQEKLSSAEKDLLLENGKKVYEAYSVLNIVSDNYYATQNSSFFIDGKPQTFNQYVTELLKNNPSSSIKKNVKIGEIECTLSLEKRRKSWKIKLEKSHPDAHIDNAKTPLKKVSDYEGKDFITLCQTYPLTVRFQAKTQKYSFSTCIQTKDQTFTLGGENKKELYQLHIINLYKMLDYVQKGGSSLNELVDMVTGSGKSITQALWAFILYLSDISFIFSAHDDASVEQLYDEFRQLLPRTMMNQISIDPKKFSGNPPYWQITTHQKLLMDFWPILANNRSDKKPYLSFDETHRAFQEELLKKRICHLAKSFPTLFLTATPSQEIYALCEKEGIISLSRKEKEELKISAPPISVTKAAESPIRKGLSRDNNFFDKITNILDGLILKFVDSIQPEELSAAHTYVFTCEETITLHPENASSIKINPQNEEELLHWTRWCVQSPLGKKGLILTEDPDTIVNLSQLLTTDPRFYRSARIDDPYRKGNKVNRSGVYNFFSFVDLDRRCKDRYEADLLETRKSKFLTLLTEKFGENTSNAAIINKIDFRKHEDYLKYRVIHSIIEKTLSYLTGKEEKTLDRARLNHLEELVLEVTHIINQKPITPGYAKILFYEHSGYSAERTQNYIKSLQNGEQPSHRPALVKVVFGSGKKEKTTFFLCVKNADATNSCIEIQDSSFLDHSLFLVDQSNYLRIFEDKHPEIFALLQKYNVSPTNLPAPIENCLDITRYLINNKIPEMLAAEIAPLMFEIIYQIHDLSQQKSDEAKKKLKKIIDNWSLDKKLHDFFKDENLKEINQFAEKHKAVFLINGLEETAIEIQSNRPFFSLKEQEYSFDEAIVVNNPKLRHARSSIVERFDQEARQFVYSPQYCPNSYTEAAVDALFKQGFVGAYVSQKTTGFNNTTLEHTALIPGSRETRFNSPSEVTQSSGRNRCLNPLQTSHFLYIPDEKNSIYFPPELLEEKDHHPAFFEANRKRQQEIIYTFSKAIAEKIQFWINAHIDVEGNVDLEKLKEMCQKIIVAEFERLYNDVCDHDFVKAKALFAVILEDTYQTLYNEARELKNSFKGLSLDMKILLAILTAISTIYYHLISTVSDLHFVFMYLSLPIREYFFRRDMTLAGEFLNQWLDQKSCDGIMDFSKIYQSWESLEGKSFFSSDYISFDAFLNQTIFSGQYYIQNLQDALGISQETPSINANNIKENWKNFFATTPHSAAYEKTYGHIILNHDYQSFHAVSLEGLHFTKVLDEKNHELLDFLKQNSLRCLSLPMQERLYNAYLPFIGTIDQQLALLELLKNPDTQFPLSEEELTVLAENLDTPEQQLDLFQKVINRSPIVKQYFEKKQPIVEKNRRQNAIEELKKLSENNNHQLNNWLKPLTTFISPQDANFLNTLDHKQIDIECLKKCLIEKFTQVSGKKHPIEKLIRAALTAEAEKQADENRFLNAPKPFKFELDTKKLKSFLNAQLTSYFELPTLAKAVNAVMDIENEHLLMLLNVIYPRAKGEDSNDNKLKKLRAFTHAINKESPETIIRKHLLNSFLGPTEDKGKDENSFRLCLLWIIALHTEILDCQCYDLNMNSKGSEKDIDVRAPKLVTAAGNYLSEGQKLWKIKPKKTSSVLGGVYKKTQFINSLLQSTDNLNKIETIKTQKTVSMIKEIANCFVNPITTHFSDSFFKKVATKIQVHGQKDTPRKETLLALSKDLGQKLGNGTPFTKEEVLSEETYHVNAVRKIMSC